MVGLIAFHPAHPGRWALRRNAAESPDTTVWDRGYRKKFQIAALPAVDRLLLGKG